MIRSKKKPQEKKKQRGAVAIEFAVLFMVFFMIIYAIIAYSVPFLLTLSFKQISADAARAAVQVSPLAEAPEDYLKRISQHVYDVVDESWLPKDWVQGNCPVPKGEDNWLSLSEIDGTSFGHYREIRPAPFSQPRYHLNICLQRDYNKGDAIIPVLTVFGMDIPRLPKDENGDTFLRGRTTIRL